MERVFDIPLARLLGVEISVTIPGTEREVRIALMACNAPLPPETTDGIPKIKTTLITTEGRLALNAIDMTIPRMTVGKLRPWVAEELLYHALGEETPPEVAPYSMVGGGRKIRHLGPEPVEEKKETIG